MALKQNGTLFAQYPVRRLGGALCDMRSLFNPSRNQVGVASIDEKGSIPNGHLAPSAWFLPQTGGGISAYTGQGFSFSATGLGVQGRNIEGSASFTIDFANATGGLVVSGGGTSTFTITGTATAAAGLFATASSSFTISPTATVSALNYAIGTANFTITGSLDPYAIGYMFGSTVDGTAITNDTIASAVWAKVIEAGYSAEQIVRLLASHAAGSATGLEGADPQFIGLDGVTVRINGTYSAGTRTIDALDAE